ncbi:MAG: phosphomannose isomerase type II C-terminal cupin domain [Candidatus Diapherotrites archaeon]|nr:phosphomannose isomerase type II C-terminal cupin domain [Candidatus Diapherotrites archaeon]
MNYSEERPWGSFTKFVENTPCTVKILDISKRLSLQYHDHRTELWFVLEGTAIIETGKDEESLREEEVKEGGMKEIPCKTLHRVRPKDGECRLLEISLGEFDEKDIVRIDDDYGRK